MNQILSNLQLVKVCLITFCFDIVANDDTGIQHPISLGTFTSRLCQMSSLYREEDETASMLKA